MVHENYVWARSLEVGQRLLTRFRRIYVEPLLDASLAHVESIRIGTKAPAYWPQRFVSDSDAGELLRLFERVRASGRHLALMSHYSHPRELEVALLERPDGTVEAYGPGEVFPGRDFYDYEAKYAPGEIGRAHV